MNTGYMKMLIGPDGFIVSALAEGEEMVFQVAGNCMEPALKHQASVRLERSGFFIPGDVVAFYCPNLKQLLMHRLLGYVRRRGAWKLMTMADQRKRPDSLVDVFAVLGRVTARDNQRYRIPLSVRLRAMCRYAEWCFRLIARRLAS